MVMVKRENVTKCLLYFFDFLIFFESRLYLLWCTLAFARADKQLYVNQTSSEKYQYNTISTSTTQITRKNIERHFFNEGELYFFNRTEYELEQRKTRDSAYVSVP